MRHTFIIAIAFLMMACSNPQKSDAGSQETVEEQTSVGGERDDHGCFISAGEVWSKIRQECVQIFNVGLRLNPVEDQDKDDAVFSSFVDRKSTRLNSSHVAISYAVFCLKKKK